MSAFPIQRASKRYRLTGEKWNRGPVRRDPRPALINRRGDFDLIWQRLRAKLHGLRGTVNFGWLLRALHTPRSGALHWSTATEFALRRLVSSSLAALIVYGGYRMFML
jgi:hypothetical protein